MKIIEAATKSSFFFALKTFVKVLIEEEYLPSLNKRAIRINLTDLKNNILPDNNPIEKTSDK